MPEETVCQDSKGWFSSGSKFPLKGCISKDEATSFASSLDFHTVNGCQFHPSFRGSVWKEALPVSFPFILDPTFAHALFIEAGTPLLFRSNNDQSTVEYVPDRSGWLPMLMFRASTISIQALSPNSTHMLYANIYTSFADVYRSSHSRTFYDLAIEISQGKLRRCGPSLRDGCSFNEQGQLVQDS